MSARGFLPYGRHLLEEDDIAAVVEALSAERLTTGPQVGAFEAELAESTGAGYATVCSSGTAALHMTMLALDLRPGQHAVVPAITFAATANAVRLAGAEVVFADVDPASGLMGPGNLEAALSRADGEAVAALPVHLNGQTCDLPTLAEIAERRGLAVIEDAAHALGGRYRTSDRGTPVTVGSCRHAAMASFSFHPVKTVAMGEGGAVTTNDQGLHRKLQRLRNHGMERSPEAFESGGSARDAEGRRNPWYYEIQDLGLNYRVPDLLCALGRSQLRKLARFSARRVALAARYDALLAPLAPSVQPVRRVPWCDPVWHLYAVLIDFEALGTTRAALMTALHEQGIGTQVHYIPVYRQPYYRRRYGEMRLPGAEAYYGRVLSLPLFPAMADADVERVVSALHRVLGG